MYFMSDPQALHVTRNVIPGKLGVDLHLHRVHRPLVIIIIITIQLCSPTLTVKTDTRYTKPISNDRTRPPTACTPVPTYYHRSDMSAGNSLSEPQLNSYIVYKSFSYILFCCITEINWWWWWWHVKLFWGYTRTIYDCKFNCICGTSFTTRFRFPLISTE